MSVESMRGKPEEPDEDEASRESPERKATGPLADEEPREISPDITELLETLKKTRVPEEKVDVASEREAVGERLQHVTERIEEEQQKNESLAVVRQELQVPHETSDTLKQLEEARETLEEEQRHIELAGEYNEVLDSFSDLSLEEISHIAETGKTLNGEVIRTANGKELHADLARELARIHLGGGRRITWGNLHTLRQVIDRILHDVVSVVKGVFKGAEHERKGTSPAE